MKTVSELIKEIKRLIRIDYNLIKSHNGEENSYIYFSIDYTKTVFTSLGTFKTMIDLNPAVDVYIDQDGLYGVYFKRLETGLEDDINY